MNCSCGTPDSLPESTREGYVAVLVSSDAQTAGLRKIARVNSSRCRGSRCRINGGLLDEFYLHGSLGDAPILI